jgi:hypothetical protein
MEPADATRGSIDMNGSTSGRKMTAAQLIVLAGDDLHNSGVTEFTEFELTVAAWRRDRDRFGLRGFQDKHPDHKRVMMEIMGQKPHNPIHLKFMEKVRPNVYRMTTEGRREAERLHQQLAGAAPEPKKSAQAKREATRLPPIAPAKAFKVATSPEGLYDQIYEYVFHAAFLAWKDDSDQPTKFASVEQFLSAKRPIEDRYAERMSEIAATADAAAKYCDANDLSFLAHGTKNNRRINAADLARLQDFLKVLARRFDGEIKGGKRKPIKA